MAISLLHRRGTATVDADFDHQSQVVLTRIDAGTVRTATEPLVTAPREAAPGVRGR